MSSLASRETSTNNKGVSSSWDQDAKRQPTIDAGGKGGKRVASFETLGPIANAENEGLENLVEYFGHLFSDDRRVFKGICQDKERDEVALDNTEQDKSGCELKSHKIDSKLTTATQEKLRLKVWWTSST